MMGLPFQFSVRASAIQAADPEDRARLSDERDTELEDFLAALLGNGTWLLPLRLGPNRLWVDSTGDLRVKVGAPTSDTDGTIVGTQS